MNCKNKHDRGSEDCRNKLSYLFFIFRMAAFFSGAGCWGRRSCIWKNESGVYVGGRGRKGEKRAHQHVGNYYILQSRNIHLSLFDDMQIKVLDRV